MSIFEYPLRMEAKVTIAIPEAPSYQIRAWELRLIPGAAGDPTTGEWSSYDVPAGTELGYFALVWDGSVRLRMQGSASETDPDPLESGLGVFSLDGIEKIEPATDTTSARVAIIGVLGSETEAPDMRLPGRGSNRGAALPMSGTPSNLQYLTVILRQLLFLDPDTNSTYPANPEFWPRPGYFLTTIDGPHVNDLCREPADSDERKQLDFISLPAGEDARFRLCDPKYPLAYIIDFYAMDDDAPARGDVHPEPGCNIRCWGP